MGITWPGWLVPGTCTEVILLLHHLDHRNMCTKICNTLTWLPTKCPMPMASSINLILAGITHITMALCHPSVNSPLAPLTSSQSNALQQLMVILHGTTKLEVPPPSILPTTVPSMRVPPSPAVTTMHDALLRVNTAAPPGMVASPGINPLPEHMLHVILDDHTTVLQTNDIVP